ARDREQHSAWELFSYKEDNNEATCVVAALDKIYAHESLNFNNTVDCEVISKWKAGLKDDIDARSDVYVLSNGCRKCSDESDDYYWEYTPENILGMEIVRDQSGNTLRVSESRFYNENLVQTLLEGHSILSLEGSISGDCDVEKNGKWSCIYAIGSQEYQVVCTRLDIASADVGMLDKFDLRLQTDEAIWLKELAIESRFELTIVAGIATGALSKDGLGCGLYLNVDKTEVFWPNEDPRSRRACIFSPNIARPLHGVKLLGGPASVDFEFCNELVIKRVTKTIRLMDAIAKINDPQCELLLLRSCAEISRLYFTIRTCPPRVLERSTLPFAFGDLDVYSACDFLNYAFIASQLQSAGLQTKLLRHTGIVSTRPNFNDALSGFNPSMNTDLLNNPTCSRVFAGDIYGDHVVSCAGIIGIKHPHNVVHDTLVDICYRSGISVGKEVDIGLDGGRDKPLRLVDMLLYSWGEGLDVCVDLTGSSPLTQIGMVDFVPGRAVIDAA
nr:zinc finger, CCHC-type [Tanacetum cinerariifolium]